MYELPHFDFHFYLMPNEERNKITADNQTQFAKAPAAQYLPADYMQAPGGIPRMGAHWVDKTAPELQGKPFTVTFIYGTYDGKVTFYEPWFPWFSSRTSRISPPRSNSRRIPPGIG